MSAPTQDENRAASLHSLSNRLHDSYSTTGRVDALEQSIQAARDAIQATPAWGARARAIRLNDLGIMLADRYQGTGSLCDLDESIQVTGEAVALVWEGHPKRALFLNNLGTWLYQRHLKTNAVADLDEAIRLARRTLKLAANQDETAGRLHNLSQRLRMRYTRMQATPDLDEAILFAKQAVDLTARGHPYSASYRLNLAHELHGKYLQTKDIETLEQAIGLARQAVEDTPAESPDQAASLSLGRWLQDKYTITRQVRDLDESIQIIRQASCHTQGSHPVLVALLSALGSAFHKRFKRTRKEEDLKEAMVNFRNSLNQPNGSVQMRIQAGHVLILASSITSDWQQGYEAAKAAGRLISQLMSRSLQIPDKQFVVRGIAGLAPNAAAVALQAGKGGAVALDFVEQGRGVLVASLEELRPDLAALQEMHPVLAHRFLLLRDELQPSVASSIDPADEEQLSSWQSQSTRWYDAGNELDSVIDQVRKQPGFANFLKAPSTPELPGAARFGPIIVLTMSRIRCDAILIEQHAIRTVSLPNLSRNDAEEKLQHGNVGTQGVLEWLWDVVAEPILDALGFLQAPSGDEWPHVWWVPTGMLCKFPLHAAGRHASGCGETVLDRVMSSYSPSVGAILRGRRRRIAAATGTARALLVAMQDTPGLSRLQFAEQEVAMLRDLCIKNGFDPIQPKQHRQDVVCQLPSCKIFHFAGHGRADSADPSKSCLLLQDWQRDPLTVAMLLETNIRQDSPFLAYLSACGTGQVKHDKFLDESIHLIGACQLAGFRHVIGTLWEVNDESCVDVARITYTEIWKAGMTDASVCRGLHMAIRQLRQYWLEDHLNTAQVGSSRKARPLTSESDVPRTVGSGKLDEGGPTRDVIFCDDDDDSRRPCEWVPYVHFGV